MEHILQAYGLPKEPATAIMMLYKNKKEKVHSTDGDTNFFVIALGVLPRDTLAPYVFIISQDHGLRTSIELMKGNVFTLRKVRSRRYSTETIMDVDYADDIALLANTQAECLLHSIEPAAEGTSLHVNANKTEYICLTKKETPPL